MNAADLIQCITERAQEADVRLEDLEIRIAHQPSWPFEYSIDEYPDMGVVQVTETRYDGSPGDEINCLYLPEGHQIGYLPGVAAESIGWR